MSFNQFNVSRLIYDLGYDGNNAGRATAEQSGSAITNSSLSSPLTGSTYCRRFRHVSNTLRGADDRGYTITEIKSFISSGVQGGVFVDTNNAYSISLRSKVRMENQVCFGDHPAVQNFNGYNQANYIGVTAYAPTSSITGFNVDYSGGYELVLQKGKRDDPTQLVIRVGQAITNIPADPLIPNVSVVCSGSYSLGQWHHIRMDVIPASLSQKTINAYTSSNGGSTWDLVGTCNVNSGPSYRETGNSGFISSKIQSSYNAITSNYSIDTFIDDFEAYVST